MAAAVDAVEEDLVAVVATVEVAATAAEVVVEAAVVVVAVVIVAAVSPRTLTHAADNHDRSIRGIDYLNSHCLLLTTQGDQAYKTV